MRSRRGTPLPGTRPRRGADVWRIGLRSREGASNRGGHSGGTLSTGHFARITRSLSAGYGIFLTAAGARSRPYVEVDGGFEEHCGRLDGHACPHHAAALIRVPAEAIRTKILTS